MEDVSVCRAAYVIPYVEVLRDIGVPVERELERGNLPVELECSPEDFVSDYLSMEFLGKLERREGIDDLGWLWAQRFSGSSFSPELKGILCLQPTVKARLDTFADLIKLEDSELQIGFIRHGSTVEVFGDATPPHGIGGVNVREWAQVMAMVEVVRGIVGQSWLPDEIRFKSDFKVCDEARVAFPATRFISRANHTSIVFPSSLLAASTMLCREAPAYDLTAIGHRAEKDTIGTLKRLLRPYLRTRTPKIDTFAEITGVSPRTLQRKLGQHGTSYSRLIEVARFEMATEMLRVPDARLIDVAMTLGYENQSNFGRSFRRIA